MDHTAVVVLLGCALGLMTLAFAWAFRRYHQQGGAVPLIINNLDDEARRLIAEACSKPTGDIVHVPDGPITSAELQRRGTDAELEGRAIEIITRMGFPRPGDPLGVKPCVPVPVSEMECLRGLVGQLAKDEPLVGEHPAIRVYSMLTRLLENHERIVCTIGDPQP